jgi:hypothetical protein
MLGEQEFIYIIGIIIIILFVLFAYREKPLREGLPPFTAPFEVPLGNFMSTFPQAAANFIANKSQQIAIFGATKTFEASKFAAAKADAAAKFAATKANAAAKFAQTQATAAKNAVQAQATAAKNAAQAQATAAKNAAQAKLTAMKNQASTMSGFAKGALQLTMFAGKVFLFFNFFGKVLLWCFFNVTCGLEWFMNFRQCFFWYLLEIIGNILYLPINFLVWILPTLKPIERMLWQLLTDIDCSIFGILGFHVIHYSEDVLKRCYKCNPGPFPKFDLKF